MVGYGSLRDWEFDDYRVVKQLDKADCAICCAAMATGRSWREIRDAFGDYYDPDMGTMFLKRALTDRLGLRITETRWLTQGIPAIACYYMKSENGFHYRHCVFWTGYELIDPSHSPKKYKNLDQVLEISS